jgi:hypothetical protein
MRAMSETAGEGRARAANADPTKELAGNKNADAPSKSQSNGTAGAYYDTAHKEFVIRLIDGSYQARTEKQFRRWLRHNGIIDPCAEGEKPSQKIEAFLEDIMEHHHVDYVGRIAGFQPGFHQFNGRSLLVNQGYELIKPAPSGDPEIIVKIIEGVLGIEQAQVFYCWLKLAYEALARAVLRLGQVVVFAGPRNCGKSCIQNFIITPVLGGRSEKAFLAMSGKTPFNDNLFVAEHLFIEDDSSSGDIRTRRAFGVEMKKIAANESNECHPKGRPMISLPGLRRLSISVNEEPENLALLPPMDDSLGDKVILFKAREYQMPMPTETDEQKDAFRRMISQQLPSFVKFLLEWKIPKHLREERRYGVATYQNPELLRALGLLAPETQLLNIIDEVFWKTEVTRSGRSNELESSLRQEASSEALGRINRLLSHANSFGTYLGRLSKSHPERVNKHESMGYTIFKLHAPPKTP